MSNNIRTQRLKLAREKGTHTKQEWAEMKKYFNNTCAKCNTSKTLDTTDYRPILSKYLNIVLPKKYTTNGN